MSDVEIAVAEYVDWYNHRRLHGEIGLVPPAEYESNRWASIRPAFYLETHPSQQGWFQETEPLKEPGAIHATSRLSLAVQVRWAPPLQGHRRSAALCNSITMRLSAVSFATNTRVGPACRLDGTATISTGFTRGALSSSRSAT